MTNHLIPDQKTSNALKKNLKLHFVGIGGCGMGPLAYLLAKEGHRVTGSDASSSDMTIQLTNSGICVHIGHDATHVESPDLVIYSSAIPSSNCELTAAREKAIPTYPRSRLLADLVRRYDSIVVSGSHGKTSTTALLYWALRHLGQNPSTVFGSHLMNEPMSAHLSDSPLFVVESDESDRSFLSFHPTVAIVTNIDREHLSAYGTFENLALAFERFAKQVPFYGFTVLSADCPHSRKIFKRMSHKVTTFGFHPDASFRVDPRTLSNNLISSFEVIEGQSTYRIHCQILGQFQVKNMLAAVATLRTMGFTAESLEFAFEDFPGVERRLQVLHRHPYTLISDYAHHPTELEAVFSAVSAFAPDVTLIFQPHRYSRFMSHAHTFLDLLKRIPKAVILPLYGAAEQPPPDFDAFWKEWSTTLNQQASGHVSFINESEFNDILRSVPSGGTALCCGAGSIHRMALASSTECATTLVASHAI